MKTLSIAEEYLKTLKVKEKYTAYAIDNDYNVVEGIGTIESNESWNYHNNYDDSEDVLWFRKSSIERREQKWWSLSKLEAQAKCNEQILKQIQIYQQQIDKLMTKIKSI